MYVQYWNVLDLFIAQCPCFSPSRPMCEGIFLKGKQLACEMVHLKKRWQVKLVKICLLAIQELQSRTVRSSLRKAAVATGLLTRDRPTDMASFAI